MMAARLSNVSRELAGRLLGEVSFKDRLTGWSMRQMSGSRPASFYSLAEIADFLKVPEPGTLFAHGAGGSIGYVDFEELARWLRHALGDQELAEAVEKLQARTGSYAERAGEVRSLIACRLKQCREQTATR